MDDMLGYILKRNISTDLDKWILVQILPGIDNGSGPVRATE